ncbi:MAG: tyrosine--tRNA ligase [Gammaproteobacteria bacterium]
MPIFGELVERGCVFQATDEAGIEALLASGAAPVYVGIDPTAESLHLGHLLPLLTLRRFQRAGHRPIVVLGGATALIGDPSGKFSERVMLAPETVEEATESIRRQIGRFLDLAPDPWGARILNNRDWIHPLGVIPFLRDVGKHFPMGAMLGKESVRTRLGTEGSGLSFTEFSYLLLQAYDYDHLCQSEGCRLQVGGSDQWGNITAGIDLIRRRQGLEAYGLTLPLVTTAAGTKLGKTEAGTVWLDAQRTSPYAFYQYLLQIDDRDVGRLLRYFSERECAAIRALEEAHALEPEKRTAQKALAYELTALVHGSRETDRVMRVSETLFDGRSISDLDSESFRLLESAIPGTVVPATPEGWQLVDLLVATGLVSSKSRARSDIQAGAISVNQLRVDAVGKRLARDEFLWGRYLLLRHGRRHYAWVRLDREG